MSKVMKQKKSKSSRSSATTANDNITDPRFTNIQTDPRFRLPSKRNTHVQIDKRFAHMLRDERFSSKAKVDRYGRKLPKDSGRKELERFYRVEDDLLGDEDEEDIDDDKDVERELQRVKGKSNSSTDGGTSSSSSEDSSDEEEVEVGEEEVIGFPDQQGDQNGGIPSGEVTSRIAVVNLDWDNIQADDLMAVFLSFVPDSGRILKVSIYPSEFGKERMEREEMEGPPKDIYTKKQPDSPDDALLPSSDEDEEADEDEEEDEKIKQSIVKEDQGAEFDSAKLRRYQLERLRYYYAVLLCSSKSTAESIYNAVDGTEYLTTANFFDLRFVTDDTDFSDDKPRDECERIPDGYRPNDFVTDALQHSKVKLTWDADDGTRKEVQRRAFAGSRADIDENDLKAYLGSDSSDDEALKPTIIDTSIEKIVNDRSDADKPLSEPMQSKKDAERQRMRALLGLGSEPAPSRKSKTSEKAPIGDMQITFSSGLSANTKGASVFENEPLTEETTVEKYIRKEKERKARRKEKTKGTRNGTDPDPATHTNDPSPKLETEIEAQTTTEPADLGFQDPFFTAPAHEKATTSALRTEQKRLKRSERAAASATTSAQRAELELLLDNHDASKNSPLITHFNMTDLAKADKALLKKGKKRFSKREKDALQEKAKDTFVMDVKDPRFAKVWEESAFAIDPGSGRFSGTEGMRRLLEEGRRNRALGRGGSKDEGEGEGEGLDGGERERRKKRRRGEEEEEEEEGRDGGEDLQKLVARVKGKAKGKGKKG